MTTDVAHTCRIPIRKMELLSGELRLLKGAIEQLHGRFDLLLAEIAGLQRDHEAANVAAAGEIVPLALTEQTEVPPGPEMSDALSSAPACSVLDADREEIDLAAYIAHEGSAGATVIPRADPLGAIHCIDAEEIAHDAVAEAAPGPLGDSGIPARKAPRTEEASPSEPTLPESAPLAVAANEPTSDPTATLSVSAVLAIPSNACEIIVLDERRREISRGSRTSIRTAARWAAAIALIALIGTVAVANTGFASNVGELLKLTDACSPASVICTVLRRATARD